MSQSGPKKNPAYYCFAQQHDSSCHVIPFINLQILRSMRNHATFENELSLISHPGWYTKREWFPETFKWTKSWQKAMANLINNKGAFYDMQQKQLQEGLINGHFYTSDGKRVDNTWNPIKNYINMLMYPFNFTDADTMPEELAWEHINESYKTLPLVWDDGKAFCFDEDANDYIKLEEVNRNGDWDVALAILPGTSMEQVKTKEESVASLTYSARNFASVSQESVTYSKSTLSNAMQSIGLISGSLWETVEDSFDSLYASAFPGSADRIEPGMSKLDNQDNVFHSPQTHRYFKLSAAQKNLLELPDRTVLNTYQYSALGFEIAFKYQYLPHEAQQHSYYMASLCQLILFGMGLDTNNIPITKTHPHYDAYQEFNSFMAAQPNNPWTLPSFNKENFLEYHIAELIKKNPDLKQRMQSNVSILCDTWGKYKEIESLFDENNQPLSDRKVHMMGEEQYLAYCYVQSARFLWAAATSREAFNAVLELDPVLARLMRLPGTPGPNQVMRNAQLKMNGQSFLDTWEVIRKHLGSDPGIPEDLASFSSHGMVISTKDDLLQAQNQSGVQNANIINRLGMAVIDSYYGEQLSPMYRQISHTHQDQPPCNIRSLCATNEITKKFRKR